MIAVTQRAWVVELHATRFDQEQRNARSAISHPRSQVKAGDRFIVAPRTQRRSVIGGSLETSDASIMVSRRPVAAL
jgi:hypothetical protein